MNNAPFHVGQKVVCVRSSRDGYIKEGVIDVVAENHYCSSCNHWHTTLRGFYGEIGSFLCTKCHTHLANTFYDGCCSNHFAPIEPRSVSTPESLKEQAEEMISVKETIKEPKKELVN